MRLVCLLLVWLSIGSCGASRRAKAEADTTAFVQLEFNVPSRHKATALEIHSYDNIPVLASRSLDAISGKVTLTDTLARPQNGPLAAFVQMADGSLWTARLEGGEALPHGGRHFAVELSELTETPRPSSIRAELLRQHRLPVGPGEYSGIAPVSDSVYAVVHDKGAGGGIHFFHIPIEPSGVVGFVQEKEAPGNAGQEPGHDNEDVVYVPSSNTLFVSSEADQQVREYTLEGQPTGRSLQIPADLRDIQSNAGFEALAYDSVGGYFWAMTEQSLREEGLHRRMLRLQRFSARTLEADARYFYLLGAPHTAPSDAAAASAYVSGLSAMTVLDDGRLITLEREVYVPSGSVLDKALGAFTLSTLYVIDPLHDTAGILGKEVLCRVVTSALNLANYEGLCLGPRLSGGARLLLLLADSQAGAGGLTAEYIQLIAIQ